MSGAWATGDGEIEIWYLVKFKKKEHFVEVLRASYFPEQGLDIRQVDLVAIDFLSDLARVVLLRSIGGFPPKSEPRTSRVENLVKSC